MLVDIQAIVDTPCDWMFNTNLTGLLASIGVARSYSSHPFLCALAVHLNLIPRLSEAGNETRSKLPRSQALPTAPMKDKNIGENLGYLIYPHPKNHSLKTE